MTTTTTPRPAGARRAAGDQPLLQVRNLSVEFGLKGQKRVRAVDEVSFDIHAGEHVGLVGESGSGKSVTSLAVMGLLPSRGVHVSGEVLYRGQNLLEQSPKQLSRLRGREIAMVFQDPMTSLNPVIPVGLQLTEVIRRHQDVSRKAAQRRAVELLDQVGIPDPARRVGEYPHQLSGGMRQRVLIAIALACGPKLLIADEPTTALDVTIQAQVLEVLKELVAETDAALLMITHDLGVVAGLCDQVNVMYSGRIVESAERGPLFATPRHPYTGGLLDSIPRLDSPRGSRLTPIPGSPTQTIPWSEGCAFAPRCQNRVERCTAEPPALLAGEDRLLRCYNPLSSTGPSSTGPSTTAEEATP
ncbi:ABC transporter ATP-binding protein [Nocardioides solisilvae]|uniref:ABC transporter ATP-binding protein n=1 Tax=Nocardioides solisilvae TaxID=1542435 RepID=UPI000D74CDE2|nr:ABC transporter ATP-binding protein [Nocardioides solisilvae]